MNPISNPVRKRESAFWGQLKSHTKKHSDFILTRVETYGTQGFPDVVACGPNGIFHMIELKHQFGKKVELSPHQVAFQARHKNAPVWTLIKKSTVRKTGYDLFLYHAKKVVDLKMDGLEVRPCCYVSEAQKIGWNRIFKTLLNWEVKLCS